MRRASRTSGESSSGEVGDGEGSGGEELAEGVEGGLEVAPAAEEVEGGFAGRFYLVRWQACTYRMSRGRVWTRGWVRGGRKTGGVMDITDGSGGEASG